MRATRGAKVYERDVPQGDLIHCPRCAEPIRPGQACPTCARARAQAARPIVPAVSEALRLALIRRAAARAGAGKPPAPPGDRSAAADPRPPSPPAKENPMPRGVYPRVDARPKLKGGPCANPNKNPKCSGVAGHKGLCMSCAQIARSIRLGLRKPGDASPLPPSRRPGARDGRAKGGDGKCRNPRNYARCKGTVSKWSATGLCNPCGALESSIRRGIRSPDDASPLPPSARRQNRRAAEGAAERVWRCGGGCGAAVSARGARCPDCAARNLPAVRGPEPPVRMPPPDGASPLAGGLVGLIASAARASESVAGSFILERGKRLHVEIDFNM